MNLIFAFAYLGNWMGVRVLTSLHRVLAFFVVLFGIMFAHISEGLLSAFL